MINPTRVRDAAGPMLEPWLLLKSILAGIAVAAPVGPMSLLCMQRALHAGPAQGLAFWAGIAAADGTYAAVEAVALTAVASLLLAGGLWWRIAGALVLLYFAVPILRAPPGPAPHPPVGRSRWRGFPRRWRSRSAFSPARCCGGRC